METGFHIGHTDAHKLVYSFWILQAERETGVLIHQSVWVNPRVNSECQDVIRRFGLDIEPPMAVKDVAANDVFSLWNYFAPTFRHFISLEKCLENGRQNAERESRV